jgi:hypothetical protein
MWGAIDCGNKRDPELFTNSMGFYAAEDAASKSGLYCRIWQFQ